MELREQGYGAGEVDDPMYVLAGRDEGYVPFYDSTRTKSRREATQGVGIPASPRALTAPVVSGVLRTSVAMSRSGAGRTSGLAR